MIATSRADAARPGERRRAFTPFNGISGGVKGRSGRPTEAPKRAPAKKEQVNHQMSGAPLGSYEGEYNADGEREGRGTFYTEDGAKYEGSWLEDKYDVLGVYHFTNEDVFRGHFQAGLQDGKGTLHWADGEVEVCNCRAGKRIGVGVRWNAERTRAIRFLDGDEKAEISLAEARQWLQTLGMEAPTVLQKPERRRDTMDVVSKRKEDVVHYSFFG